MEGQIIFKSFYVTLTGITTPSVQINVDLTDIPDSLPKKIEIKNLCFVALDVDSARYSTDYVTLNSILFNNTSVYINSNNVYKYPLSFSPRFVFNG